MEELCKNIDTIAKDWKSWRQRSFDFNGTVAPGEPKFSKEDEMKYLYNAYETAKNDKVVDILNDHCDKATKEFEEQVTKEIIKLVENNKEIFHEMFNELLLYGKTDTKKYMNKIKNSPFLL